MVDGASWIQGRGRVLDSEMVCVVLGFGKDLGKTLAKVLGKESLEEESFGKIKKRLPY